MSERALVIVPTYNERENIRPLIESVLAKDPRIDMLIVDDGSPDGTGRIADELAVEFPGRLDVMHRTGPRGLGRAYIDGLRAAIADGSADLICQMDADLSHNPDYLPAARAGR